MTEILDVPAYRERMKLWTVEEFERLADIPGWPKRMELIRGVLIENMPKSPLHCALAKWLYDRFHVQLPAHYQAFSERPLRLADSEPEPDVMVVRGEEREFRQAHPVTAELVVEIAVSNPGLDRQNAVLYAEAGVRELWIVLAREQAIEVYRKPVLGSYSEVRTYHSGERISLEEPGEISFALEELFA